MMDHSEEEPPDTGLVRPYVIAGDTVVSQEDGGLLLITLVTASEVAPPPAASPEKRQLWDICSGGYLSVAETAGYVQLPLGIVKFLLADLARSGHLLVREPPPAARHADVQVLQEVLHGLRARFG